MKNPTKFVQNCCDNSFEQIYSLESIIKLTKNACLEKEFNASYYELPQKYKTILSEERNLYINMLNIAQDKVEALKRINDQLETNVIDYISMPTMAADK